MITRVALLSTRRLVKWFLLAVCVAVGSLMWLGFQAINEWQRSAALLAQRRADEAISLFLTITTQDMRGVQKTVLPALPSVLHEGSLPAGIEHIASAFARYSYPETFFIWRATATPPAVRFYGRAARLSSWLPADAGQNRFPVVVGDAPLIGQQIISRINKDTAHGRPFSIFDIQLDRTTYQVVTLLTYADAFNESPQGAFGFIVNLDWVRHYYFQELAALLARLERVPSGVTFSVLDGRNRPIVGALPPQQAPSSIRTFPLMFFDPLLTIAPPPDLGLESWTAASIVSADPTVLAANSGARRTLAVGSVAILLLAAGFTLTLQAARASADLAQIRAEFVSTVTHELKSPIATIRAIAETLASGRGGNSETSRGYAQLATHEAKRLTRLIDNLLAYSRVTDVTEVYVFAPVPPECLLEETLSEFESQLADSGFDVDLDIPSGLPLIRIDQTAASLMLRNIVDNAMRYSKDTRQLRISAKPNGKNVIIEVIDRGIGIPRDDIEHVKRRFFRGGRSEPGGTGLGLAIADRIVADHGGVLDIRSTVGVGTTVSIALPIAKINDEEAYPHS